MSRATSFITRAIAFSATANTSSSGCLSGTAISDTPRNALNSTTAGTTLFASALKGFDGM